ncbi:MAG: prepilin-type N-terminal cleavage/methylation domain-containing protein [Candidatus Omnitrophica bacterium]|nr:prepilin-type N-terminal cleavage/methylation domain-containing protein [Candidatus Omnitrophota bacterium]
MKKEHGFTLLELIVVIVILGILATLGFTQYNKVVEKMRISEAVAGISSIRKLVHTYWLEHGDLSTITNADVGVGSNPGDIPTTCVSTNYFYYFVNQQTQIKLQIQAPRCTSGGKSPNWTGNRYEIYMDYYPGTGSGTLYCWDYVLGQNVSWCQP